MPPGLPATRCAYIVPNLLVILCSYTVMLAFYPLLPQDEMESLEIDLKNKTQLARDRGDMALQVAAEKEAIHMQLKIVEVRVTMFGF